VGWQNGRILGELVTNALHRKALQLEKYSAKGVCDLAEWQNTFEKPVPFVKKIFCLSKNK
jgi:hypothetical protein